jgi:hypothetical protein
VEQELIILPEHKNKPNLIFFIVIWYPIWPHICDIAMSEWLLFNTNSAIFQLYQWDDDEVRFVLDQHAELDLYSASSLNNSPRADMSLHSDTLFWFRANQSLLFLLNDACLAEKQQIPIL